MCSKRFVRAYVVFCLMVILLSASPAAAEKLRWRLTPGQKFLQEMVQDMTTSIVAGGQTINTKVKQTIDSEWSIKDVDAQGVASITQVITRIRMNMEGAGGLNAQIDTASAEEPQGVAAIIAKPLTAMTNAPFEIRMDATGKILDVKVAKETIDALRALPGAGQMGAMFSEEGLVNMVKQGTPRLPADDVNVGDRWSSSMEVKLPQLGKMSTNTEMTYQGTEVVDGKRLAKIAMRLTTQVAAAENPLVRISIKEQDAKGVMWFDNQAGHIHSTEMDQNMVMQLAVGNNTFDQTIQQKVTVKFTESQ